MAPTKHPLIDLVYNDETGRYIGHLERKLVKLTIDDLKFRALLELLTGDDWDDYHFGPEDEELQKLAVDALKRRLGLSTMDAQKMVAARWSEHNPPPADPATQTYLIGPHPNNTKMPHNVTIARPIAAQQTASFDYRKHLAGLQQTAHDKAMRRKQADLSL